MLCSCKTEKHLYEYTQVSYKGDINSERGTFSAVYAGKIYYFSDEIEKNGVYCMNMDGSDIKLLFECKDVSGIQIVDEVIYASVLQEKRFRERKVYDLVAYSLESEELKYVLNSALKDKYAAYEGFTGVNDFFVENEENIFINIRGYQDERSIIENQMFYQNNNEIVEIFEKAILISDYTDEINGQVFFVYKMGDNYFVSNTDGAGLEREKPDSRIRVSARDIYGYNCEKDAVWWGDNALKNKWEGIVKIWGIADEKLILSTDYGIFFAYDIREKRVAWQVNLSDVGQDLDVDREIIYVDVNNEYFNIVTEKNTPSIYHKEDDKSHQILYRVDLSSKEVQVLKEYETGGKVIYIDGNKLIDYDGESLNLINLKWPDVIQCAYDMEQIGNGQGYQLEAAGDWVFVKAFNREQGKAHLLCKVLLK